jgi:hypothetical protein
MTMPRSIQLYASPDIVVHTTGAPCATLVQLMNPTVRRVLSDYPADADGRILFIGTALEMDASLAAFFQRADTLGLVTLVH